MSEQVKELPRDNFAVRQHLKYVELYSLEENYQALTFEDTLLVKEEVAPLILPDNDEMFNTKGKMLQDIMTLLGGRIAEEIIFGDITTGASNDIKRATATARSMVMKYGMSDKLGLICYGDDDDEVFIGRDLAHTRSYSEDVAKSIDEEIRRIISECHDQAKKIILEHEDVLHKCASLLLEKEKVHRDEFEALFTTENPETENNSI